MRKTRHHIFNYFFICSHDYYESLFRYISSFFTFFLIKNGTLNKWVDEKVGLHILEKENIILAEGVVPAERELQEENPDKVGVNNENYIIKSRCEDRFSKNFKVLKFNKKIQLENFKTNCIDIGKIRLLLIELSNSNKTVDNTTNEIKILLENILKRTKKGGLFKQNKNDLQLLFPGITSSRYKKNDRIIPNLLKGEVIKNRVTEIKDKYDKLKKDFYDNNNYGLITPNSVKVIDEIKKDVGRTLGNIYNYYYIRFNFDDDTLKKINKNTIEYDKLKDFQTQNNYLIEKDEIFYTLVVSYKNELQEYNIQKKCYDNSNNLVYEKDCFIFNNPDSLEGNKDIGKK